MKHDEKKIEEVLECVNYTQYTQLEVERAIKQYAEYMVQQDRDRIVKLFHLIDTERDGKSEYSLAEVFETKLEAFDYGQEQYRKDVINLINQDL